MSTLIRINEITGNDCLTVEHCWDGKSQVRAVRLQDFVDAIVALLPTSLIRQHYVGVQSYLRLQQQLAFTGGKPDKSK